MKRQVRAWTEIGVRGALLNPSLLLTVYSTGLPRWQPAGPRLQFSRATTQKWDRRNSIHRKEVQGQIIIQ